MNMHRLSPFVDDVADRIRAGAADSVEHRIRGARRARAAAFRAKIRALFGNPPKVTVATPVPAEDFTTVSIGVGRDRVADFVAARRRAIARSNRPQMAFKKAA